MTISTSIGSSFCSGTTKGWNFEWPITAPTVKLCNEHFRALRDTESEKKFPTGHCTKASMRKFLLRLKDKHPDLRQSVTQRTWRDACARVKLPEKYSLDGFHCNMENLLRGEKQIFDTLADQIDHENLVDKNSHFIRSSKGAKTISKRL